MAHHHWIGLLAATLLGAQPCLAAEDIRDRSSSEQRFSGFAGASFRVPLGGAKGAKPSARLQVATTLTARDARTGSVQTFRSSGLEIGAGGHGKPALFMGGQSTAEMKTQLGVKGTTGTVLLVAAGVVLLLFIVASATVPPQPDFDD